MGEETTDDFFDALYAMPEGGFNRYVCVAAPSYLGHSICCLQHYLPGMRQEDIMPCLKKLKFKPSGAGRLGKLKSSDGTKTLWCLKADDSDKGRKVKFNGVQVTGTSHWRCFFKKQPPLDIAVTLPGTGLYWGLDGKDGKLQERRRQLRAAFDVLRSAGAAVAPRVGMRPKAAARRNHHHSGVSFVPKFAICARCNAKCPLPRGTECPTEHAPPSRCKKGAC